MLPCLQPFEEQAGGLPYVISLVGHGEIPAVARYVAGLGVRHGFLVG